MDYKRLRRLYKEHPAKHKYQYSKEPSDTFMFIYMERGKRQIEYIDMSRYCGNNCEADWAVTEYKILLDNFNKSLRPHEHKRTYVKGYRVHTTTTLELIKPTL